MAPSGAAPDSDVADPRADSPKSFGSAVAAEVLPHLVLRADEMAELLGELVRIESGTDDPAGLDAMAARLEGLFGEFGPVVRHPIGPGGASHLVVRVNGYVDEPGHVLVLGHYDTVWSRGTLDTMPMTVNTADGTLAGPGSFDMKGGLVLVYYALRELTRLGLGPRRPTTLLLNCDEEVRSRTSRELITQLADGAAAALVFESPLPGGGLKTSRKGTMTYRLEIDGRAAHAGIEPEKGASAIEELARQVPVLHALNDPANGTSVNVGVVRGGTRPNVVAAHAEADIDVRVLTAAEAERVDTSIRGLQPTVPGARLSVTADLSRPPMTPTDASRALFDRARAAWAGVSTSPLAEGSTGGASDANLVAALGVPTLDGLGPEGGGAHAADEHVLIATMPTRAALVAGLLAEI